MARRDVGLRWLAALTCGGMLLVLTMGAAVTNTGSAEGCGRSWPLCNGKFVPEFTVATAIEFSHRAVTGLESLLVLGLTAAMLALWRSSREVVVLAVLMLGALLLQAGLGAGAVLWPQSPVMLATHFGVSLIAFASTFLSAAVVFERTSTSRVGLTAARRAWQAQRRGRGWLPLVRRRVSRTNRGMAVGITLYVLGVVYLGAYVRHADLSLSCLDWPMCNGQVIPPLDSVTGVVFAHRVAAFGAVVLLGYLAYRERSAAASWTFGFGVLQALSGAMIVWTRLGLLSTLLHAALMGVLFALLTYVVRGSLTGGQRHGPVPDVADLSEVAAPHMEQRDLVPHG